MKIEEPKTPFNRDYVYTEDEEGELAPKSPEKGKNDVLEWEALESAMKKAAEKEKETSLSHQDEEGEDENKVEDFSNEEEEAIEKKAFEQKRKNHYNEGAALKQLREKLKQENDDMEET